MGDHADDLMFQEMGLTRAFRTTYKCGHCGKKFGEDKADAQAHTNKCEGAKK